MSAAEALSEKKLGSDDHKVATIVADDPDAMKDAVKQIGGSQSDDWNKIIADQIIGSLWLNNSDERKRDRQISAVLPGLIGINPKDELEGMMAAQLIATHNAAMECYRRAMLGEQTFEARQQNLNQANKLSRCRPECGWNSVARSPVT